MIGKEDINVMLNRAEGMQNEMHEMYDVLIKQFPKTKMTYDSFKDIYFLIKIADLQEDIKLLKL